MTLGVELEFQLLDESTLDLSPAAPSILEAVSPDLAERIKPEFIRSMIEINTEICATVDDAAENLRHLGEELGEKARQNGCLLYAASLHPSSKCHDQLLTEDNRYTKIMNDLQLVGRRFITQGLHVHVGLDDAETAIRVCDDIRLYLPIFLAMSTSSPFFEGRDSGLHSYRAKLFEALPLAGMPGHLQSWQQFKEMTDLLIRADIITEVRDLWWDVRPHPDLGTVEVRICDLPSRFDDILAMVALIQAVVLHISLSAPKPMPNIQIIKSNKWQAARYGLAGRFVDPYTLQKTSMKEVAKDLVAMVSPECSQLGTNSHLETMERIISQGTSTDLQRRIYTETGDFQQVIRQTRQGFWK